MLFGENPRLSLNQHSLYVGVVEKSPPSPLTWEQYGKMEPKYPEGGHCQSVLRPQGDNLWLQTGIPGEMIQLINS